ncbi:small conductance mechanosensitive channel protein [Campylobacter blaseri]|uniref:Mechanosensitive ion channel protein n=1 Tax=Campylobacter blaseri TaxID=2042961 RepID=A0A2P8R3L8_9BACT|nr:mechanosensitive ion channel family protein [Campylobacter blaseri]PSM53092.1 hypothetical protein CQ405_00640 [Campylobacter blaseri]PSM54559.1 hypothetical protein CRN67_00640 [Campylobacter blaseri]QKF86970.1 small conductance mechanosensitive channel protein [Campylobacter blaseri]
MKKYITKFLLIISIITFANAEDNVSKKVDLNKTSKEVVLDSNATNLDSNETKVDENKTKSILSLDNIIKSKEEKTVADENKSAKKEEILEILSKDTDINISDTNNELVSVILKKVTEDKPSGTVNGKTLSQVVEEIKIVNLKLKALKSTVDSNSSKDITENNSLKKEKETLLESIPTAVSQQTLDKDNLLEYLKHRKELRKTLDRLKNRTGTFEYAQANLQNINVEITNIFYTTMLILEKKFNDGERESNIKKLLEDALIEIQLKKISNLKEDIEKFNNKQKDALEEDYKVLVNNQEVYEDIISFLIKNTNLISGNKLFTSLNLRDIINYINDVSPFKSSAINLGKIIPITLIMILLFSVRRFLANIIVFIVSIFYKNEENHEEIKSHVVGAIKRPLGVLLIAFGIDICSSIFYYPSPVPLNFVKTIGIIYVVLYAWLILSIIDGYGAIIIGKIAKKSERKEVLNLLVKIIYIIIILIAILLILSKLGVDVSAIVASLGIGGLAVAFATKDIIANFFASILLLFDNSLSQGDWVVVGDVEGTVVETGLRKTTIRTFDNALVSVPNSKIIDSSIKNWNRRRIGRRIRMTLTVEYSATPRQLKKCIDDIREMLLNHPGIANPSGLGRKKDQRLAYRQNMVSIDDLAGYKNTLFVVLDEFSSSSIDIMIYCFTKSIVWGEYLDVKQDVMLKIMDIMKDNNVGFAFPSRKLYVEKKDSEEEAIKDLVE